MGLPGHSAPRCAMLDGKEGWDVIPDGRQDGLGERESPVGLWIRSGCTENHVADPQSLRDEACAPLIVALTEAW